MRGVEQTESHRPANDGNGKERPGPLQIAIVEDDEAERERLKHYTETFFGERKEPVKIRTFGDGIGLVSPYQTGYDIILLDIQMPVLDGIATARKIREKDEEVILIFITNMVQYALKGYSVGAMNFVLKPVTYFAFCEEMKQALGRLKKRQASYVIVKVEDGVIRLNRNDLYYAEMQKRKVLLHTRNGVHSMSGTLLKLEGLLADERFFRCHSGCLVNLQHITQVRPDTVVLCGGEAEVPLSRHRKKELEMLLMNQIGEGL